MLQYHPGGCNKIQDKYKESEYVMVCNSPEPNDHDNKPVDGKGPVHTVNQSQLQDLKRTQEDKRCSVLDTTHQGL